MSLEEQLLSFGLMVFAAVLGAIVGLERELKDKPAGLRTHALVAASSALLIMVGPPLVEWYARGEELQTIRNEPLSILQAIILGVSFIGGGTIFKDKESKDVINLTTAATILAAATLGILVGIRLYVLAVATTFLLVLINGGLIYLEGKAKSKRS